MSELASEPNNTGRPRAAGPSLRGAVGGDNYDVVIVGGGLAGCTAAILLGRAGLDVALLEAHRHPSTYKRMCTTSIRSSALPTLRRLGVDTAIEKAGGVPAHDAFNTPYGWLHVPRMDDCPPHGYNIRRETLDPLMREAAAETAGVELVLGAKVRELTRDRQGRVDGVLAMVDGEARRFGARLVVGADGHSSKVAELAGLPGHRTDPKRFFLFAHYRGVEVPADRTLSIWLNMPDVVSVGAMDDGHVVLAAMLDKRRLPAARGDRESVLLDAYRNLPDGPDLSRAHRTSEVLSSRSYPSVTRWRITTPGVALVGDAAMVADPLEGSGCGWAVQGGEWLSDAVADAVRSGHPKRIDQAARRYERTHRFRLFPHQAQIIDLSTRLALSGVMKVVLSASVRDPKVAEQFTSVITRNRSMLKVLTPAFLARALYAAARPGA
ncbi:MAG TPA: NAD(P)/FAD-dependent oxidoreductase [Actinophytocola sp.]|nr:NAD(P)/FAD-dependent oxidoreductase [Actinophytocola sp.]